MKLTAILLFAAAMQLGAKGVSQNINLSERNASLPKLFAEIEKQTQYNFVYTDDLLHKAKAVDISIKNGSLQEVLSLVFKNQPLTYSVVEKVVIVKEKPMPTNAKEVLQSFFPPPPIDVRGKVVNENGVAVPGVTVTVKGTRIATATDLNGLFSLKGVDLNATLIFTGINLETLELKVNGKADLTVNIKTRINKLDEVQIIAYGQTTQRLTTGNVSTVKAADIEKQPINNPLLALQGRVPGILITQNTGVPGGGITIRIQGQNSLSRGNTPLYVIDGVPFTGHLLYNLSSTHGILGYNGEPTNRQSPVGGGNPLSFINPADIESIDVLKDADATSIYGSRAAQGAILITTKKGKAGQSKIELNIQSGWGKVTRRLDVMNTQQYLEMRREAFANDGTTPNINNAPDLLLWDINRDVDWQKELIGGIAQYTDMQGTISGGTPNTSFLVSSGFHKETTVFPGDLANTKGTLHLNLNHQSPNRKFKFQLSSNYMLDHNRLVSTDLTETALKMAPNAPELYNPDGTLNWAPRPNGSSSWYNPLAFLLEKKYNIKTNNLITNAIISYELLSGLELKTSLGYNNLSSSETMVFPHSAIAPETRAFSSRFGLYGDNDISSWVMEPQASYKRAFKNLKLEGLVGATFQQINSDSRQLFGMDYPSDEVIRDVNSAATLFSNWSTVLSVYKYNAGFARLNANWDDKYIINFTGRRDGSSRFGSEGRFANFGSVSGVWIFSNERFFNDNLKILSFGKTRISYGTTGSDQIGDYQYMNLYRSLSVSAPYQGSAALIPTGLANPYLEWEETRKLQMALDLGFFKDRVIIRTNYFRNLSSNQLTVYALPILTGVGNIQMNFPAEIQNKGWEITMSTQNIIGKAFNWTSDFNITIQRNKLKSFPNLDQSSYAGGYIIGQPLSISRSLSFAGVNPTTGLYEFYAADGKIISNPSWPNDWLVISNTDPVFFGGFQNSFSYKNWDLDVHFQFVKQMGRDHSFGAFPGRLRNDDIIIGNQPVSLLDRWKKPGDVASRQRLSASYPSSVRSAYFNATDSDGNIADASFARLKNLSLAWRLPDKWKQKTGLKNAKVYMHGQNMLTITSFKGLDPERGGISALPPLRVITLGIQVGF